VPVDSLSLAWKKYSIGPSTNFESTIYPILERLDIQRTRIREYLDQAKTVSERITVEKSIIEIDSKIAQINEKLHFSSQKILSYVVESLNQHFKEKNDKTRYVGIHEKLAVSNEHNTCNQDCHFFFTYSVTAVQSRI